MDGARIGRLAEADEYLELLERRVEVAVFVAAVEETEMVARGGVAPVEADSPQKGDAREVAPVARHLDDAEAGPAESPRGRIELRVLGNGREAAHGTCDVSGIEGDFGVEQGHVGSVGSEGNGLRDRVAGIGHSAQIALDARKHDERVDVSGRVGDALGEELAGLFEAAGLVRGEPVGVFPDAVLRVAAREGDAERRSERADRQMISYG